MDTPKSDDAKSDDNKAGRNVFDLIEWVDTLAAPMTLEAIHEMRAAITAGTAPPLSDREKQLLATIGLIVGHAAHDHARRMFQREAPAMLAALMARMGGGGDDDEGGGGAVQ